MHSICRRITTGGVAAVVLLALLVLASPSAGQDKPDDPVTLYNQGVELAKKGQLDDAIASYQKALALHPDYALAHYNLGLTLQQKSDRAGAQRHFAEAQRLDPNLKPPKP